MGFGSPENAKKHTPQDQIIGKTSAKGAEFNTDQGAITQNEHVSEYGAPATQQKKFDLGNGVVVIQNGAFTEVQVGNGKASLTITPSGQVNITTNSSAGININSPSGKVVLSAPSIAVESSGPLSFSGSNIDIISKKGINFRTPTGMINFESAGFSGDVSGNMMFNIGKDFGAVVGGNSRTTIGGSEKKQVSRDSRTDVGGMMKTASRGEMVMNSENSFNVYAGKSSSFNSLQELSFVSRGNMNIHSNQSFIGKIGGDTSLHTKGKTSMRSNGDMDIQTKGNMLTSSAGNSSFNSKGTMTIASDGDMSQSSGGALKTFSSGRMDVDSGDTIHMMEGGATQINAYNTDQAEAHSGVVDKGDEVETPVSGTYNYNDPNKDPKIQGNEFTKNTQAPEPVDAPSEQEVIDVASYQTHLKTNGQDAFNATRRTNERGGRLLNAGTGGDEHQPTKNNPVSRDYINKNIGQKQRRQTKVEN